KFVLVDRYIYDRYSSGKVGLALRMHLSPDYIFLLDAKIDILLERKQEHSRCVIEGFQKNYIEFLLEQDFSRCLRVDSENELHSNVSLINKVITDEY
ncbi:MAG: hypothetical protein V7785_21815, partial [Bermanella sp.]